MKKQPSAPTSVAPATVDEPSTPVDEEHYAPLQYQFVEFFAEHLADISRVFGGDLQQMLVLAILGQVLLRGYLTGAPGLRIEDVAASITASRIADVTGIPRETVRRKLLALKEKEWVVQDGSAWRLATRDGQAVAREALGDLDRRGMARIMKLAQALKPFV